MCPIFNTHLHFFLLLSLILRGTEMMNRWVAWAGVWILYVYVAWFYVTGGREVGIEHILSSWMIARLFVGVAIISVAVVWGCENLFTNLFTNLE